MSTAVQSEAIHHGNVATVSEYRIEGKKLVERPLGRVSDRVHALATLDGSVYLAAGNGRFLVATDNDISYDAPANLVPILEGHAVVHLAAASGALVAATEAGVYVMTSKRGKLGKARTVTKRAATRVAVSPTRIAFLHDASTEGNTTIEAFTVPR